MLSPYAEIKLLLVPTIHLLTKMLQPESGPSGHLALDLPGSSGHLALDLPVDMHKELHVGEDARRLVLY